MIIDIPIQNPLSQTNKGDSKGSIGETFNIDLSIKPDKICVPNKAIISTTTADIASLGLISKFVYFDDAYHAHSVGTDSGTYDAAGRIFRGGDGVDDSWSLPTWTVNTTDFNSDATIDVFGGDLILVSGDTWSISSSSDTSWTSESTNNGDSFSLVYQDRFYHTSASTIESFVDPTTPATSGSYTWTLPNSEEAFSGMDSSTSGIWISTITNSSTTTNVYLWDGVTANVYDRAYKVPHPSIMCLKVLNDVPYIVTGAGVVMAFNGSYFEEVARFPFTDILLAGIDDADSINISTTAQGKWLHNNGVDIIGNKLHFLISPIALSDSKLFGDYAKLAGIWCLDQERGLYHRFAIPDLIGGQTAQVKHVGALKSAGLSENPTVSEHGTCIFSFSYYTENSTSTEEYAIAYIEPIADVGEKHNSYITSQRIYANNVEDTWEYIGIGYEEMESTDSIEVKYRTIQREGSNVGITWTSTTAFTTTDTDMADIKEKFDLGESYECRILLGKDAGIISQITNITVSSGTYTITLDTTHTNVVATNTGQARIENWKSAKTITYTDTPFVKAPIAKQSNWIQFKIVLRGTEVAKNKHNPVLNRMVIVSNSHSKFQ